MFGRKSKSKKTVDKSKSNRIIVTEYINDKMSEVYALMSRLANGCHINLLTIGRDENDVTIQVRANKLDSMSELDDWLFRSTTKIKKVSWVAIEMVGHDEDGDYCTRTVEFTNEIGDAFLFICSDAPVNETPLHKLLTVAALS